MLKWGCSQPPEKQGLFPFHTQTQEWGSRPAFLYLILPRLASTLEVLFFPSLKPPHP